MLKNECLIWQHNWIIYKIFLCAVWTQKEFDKISLELHYFLHISFLIHLMGLRLTQDNAVVVNEKNLSEITRQKNQLFIMPMIVDL